MTHLPAIEPAYFDEAIASKLLNGTETMPRIATAKGKRAIRNFLRGLTRQKSDSQTCPDRYRAFSTS